MVIDLTPVALMALFLVVAGAFVFVFPFRREDWNLEAATRAILRDIHSIHPEFAEKFVDTPETSITRRFEQKAGGTELIVAEFAHKLRALGKRYEFDMIALVKKTPGTSEGVFVFRERLSQAAGFDVVVVESDSQGILDNKDVSGRKIAILCEHIDNGEHIKSANGCLSDRGAQVVLAVAILSIKSNAIDEIKKQTGIPVVDTLLKKTWYEYIGSREAA